LKALSIYTPPI